MLSTFERDQTEEWERQGGIKSVPWEKERRSGADMILYMTL